MNTINISIIDGLGTKKIISIFVFIVIKLNILDEVNNMRYENRRKPGNYYFITWPKQSNLDIHSKNKKKQKNRKAKKLAKIKQRINRL